MTTSSPRSDAPETVSLLFFTEDARKGDREFSGGEDSEQLANLLLHLLGAIHRTRDLLAQQLAVTLPQPLRRLLHGGLGHPEGSGDGGVARGVRLGGERGPE